MAVVRPFRGCRYDPQRAGALSTILCPPYDMIGPNLKESLQQLSPYNAVHLEGGEQPDPVDPEAGYRRAASLFQDWLAQGTLRQDAAPSFYLMRHSYPFRGATKAQLGLFAAVLVEDYGRGSVLPHEFTREPAVLDRVALLDAAKTQFSPLLTIYRDAQRELKPVLDQAMTAPPQVSVSAHPESNVGDVDLWPIEDVESQERIARFFASRPLFLADGHHRYEAALRYRQSQTLNPAATASDAADAPPAGASNYVMMSLTEFDDPGLQLLPYHKVIGGLSEAQLTGLQRGLEELFEAEPFNLSAGGGAERLARLVVERGQDCPAIGLIGPGPGSAALLTLRSDIDWRSWGTLAVSEAWALDEQVIRPLLGDQMSSYVDYSHDAEAAAAMVAEEGQQLAFLLKPFPMDAFEAIVSSGQRLPSKSTFFYPKLPTGLVMNRLDGTL